MLEFKRKQMAQIGDINLRYNLATFLQQHLAGDQPIEHNKLDAEVDAVIAQCKKHGLKSQRAIAAYAVACAVFGSARVASNASIATILANRTSPQLDRALLIEMWTASAYQGTQPSEVN